MGTDTMDTTENSLRNVLDFLRKEENKREIASKDPEKQCPVDYNKKKWQDHLGNDPDFGYVLKGLPDTISRPCIIRMGKEIKNPDDWDLDDWDHLKKFFLAIMLWGYKGIPQGPENVGKMVKDCNLRSSLEAGYRKIADGDIEGAYYLFNSWPKEIDGLKVSFFTKYFYFVGKVEGCATMPLTLDSNVAYALGKNKKWRNDVCLYMDYVDGMNRLAKEFQEEGLKVDPDHFEYFLFRRGQANKRCFF